METPHPALPAPAPSAEPRVVFWYRIYCAAMVALYLLCLVGGLALLVFRADIARVETEREIEVMVYGTILFVLGFLLLAAYLAAFFLPRARWAWIYHIVMICFGLTSLCTLPAALPLLLFWIKPETQAWYRTSN